MVGGMGRAALYLKVSPNGAWPAARSRPVAGFTRYATQPATGHSSPFPLSFLACPFTSFHFTAASAPFISLKTPSFAFLSLFVLAFSCSLVSLQRPLHFRAMPLTCISFTSSHSCFLSAPCFASPACIASSASSGMMLAMLGVLSSIRHPPKILVFGLVFGCCGEMLQKSPKRIRKSFAPYKGGPSIKRMRMFCAWSAHGRRHGARGLIPEGKPYRALACGPITSGGRI